MKAPVLLSFVFVKVVLCTGSISMKETGTSGVQALTAFNILCGMYAYCG